MRYVGSVWGVVGGCMCVGEGGGSGWCMGVNEGVVCEGGSLMV